jgi:hypothetical protein
VSRGKIGASVTRRTPRRREIHCQAHSQGLSFSNGVPRFTQRHTPTQGAAKREGKARAVGKDTLQPVALHLGRCRAARSKASNKGNTWRQRLTQQCRAKQGGRGEGLPTVPSPNGAPCRWASQRRHREEDTLPAMKIHWSVRYLTGAVWGNWWPSTRSVVDTDTERTAGRMGRMSVGRLESGSEARPKKNFSLALWT